MGQKVRPEDFLSVLRPGPLQAEVSPVDLHSAVLCERPLTRVFVVRRFLGLQVVFVCGGLLCFLLTVVFFRRRAGSREPQPEGKGGYEPVSASAKGKELEDLKTRRPEDLTA